IPMIRVDGRARFLDTGPLADDAIKQYVKVILDAQAEPKEKHDILEHKGAVDIAYPMPDKSASFRVNIFHSRERYAIVMRRIVTTVHATNAPMTIERLVSLFDPVQKDLQQTQLGLNLVAVLCQRLAKRRDAKGRIPVVEIMMATPLVRKYILEGEFEKLKGAVGNREAGSQSFDQHLTELFQKQIIDVKEAERLATNVDALKLALRGITNSDTRMK